MGARLWKRSTFLRAAGAVPAAALLSGAAAAQDATGGNLADANFELTLRISDGLDARIVHKPTGLSLTDGKYSYSFGSPSFAKSFTARGLEGYPLNLESVLPGGLRLVQSYRLSQDKRPFIEEQISISNPTDHAAYVPTARCGFTLPLSIQGGTVAGPFKDFKAIAVPYRREPTGDRGQYGDYTLAQILTEPRYSRLRADIPIDRNGNITAPMVYQTGHAQLRYPEYASEGWLLTDGRRGFLITKYSPLGMEWSVLDRVLLDQERIALRWGGFGIFEGDPEGAARLSPGSSHTFGVTRITPYVGDLTEGFYSFRAEMAERGHGCPEGFDPPVHWNELYDNKLWWLGGGETDKPENRRNYYLLSDMKQEAAKAREIGCQALYLDPGWDTSFASKIWDESRLGNMRDFSAMLRDEYSLKLSLHTPLSGWCNPTSYAPEINRMDAEGKRIEMSLCGASKQYVDETFRRLDRLAEDGASYFMFDGTMMNGECWDPAHGHAVPSTREEHVAATNRLARMVHARHPALLIEMHDQMLGGTHLRYVPTYYGHGRGPASHGTNAAGFDSVWAFELMWDPMTDLVGGHSMALYYYNLAYSLPLYIHIDLRKDNAEALMFWWNASTCRHLGIGGTHADPEVWKAHKSAMAAYRRLKPFFTAGTFYGIDELTHVHRHPAEPRAVVNCFNLEDRPVERKVAFDPARFGLDAARSYKITGGSGSQSGSGYSIRVAIRRYGHTLLEIA
jgi:hypothetical protein